MCFSSGRRWRSLERKHYFEVANPERRIRPLDAALPCTIYGLRFNDARVLHPRAARRRALLAEPAERVAAPVQPDEQQVQGLPGGVPPFPVDFGESVPVVAG